MKKVLKVVSLLIGIIVVIILLVLAYLQITYPRSNPPEDIIIKTTAQRLQRGKYLSNHVAACIGCHSIRDWTKFAAPPKPETVGGGGDQIDERSGFPGTVVIKNITPAALESWSDGELIRAITCGVTREDEPLFPIMPFPDYNVLSREDLYSIIAYLKTLDRIKNNYPKTKLNFPINFIARTLPLQSYKPTQALSDSTGAIYGNYLSTIASCAGCHSQMNRGQYIEGMQYAGGREFKISSGVVRSSNITPSNDLGIGRWTKEMFIRRFKNLETESASNFRVGSQDFNTPMPWTQYAGMTEKDLGAIFEYLRTLEPVENQVVKWTPAHVTK